MDPARERAMENEKNANRDVIGQSMVFSSVLEVARRAAKSNSTILITGESGTGKEVIAKFIHTESRRASGAFVPINCSAIPENLLESELFGHARGAFTGAVDKKLGLFEAAEGGTLFLDEIGDLSLTLQAKILRVLQDKCITRVGENRARKVDVRIISATHKNLPIEILEKRFREDLYFRLNVIPIHLPPLRERREDILPLVDHFMERFALVSQIPAKKISKEGIQFLHAHPWQGNIRELENTIERALVLCERDMITDQDLMSNATPLECEREIFMNRNAFVLEFRNGLLPLREVVQRYVEFALERNEGAKDKTAHDLKIDRKTLYKRLSSKDRRSSAIEPLTRVGEVTPLVEASPPPLPPAESRAAVSSGDVV